MRFADRDRALKAYRLSSKIEGGKALAAELKVESAAVARLLANTGYRIKAAESFRLTERELLLMRVLARVEARRTLCGASSPKSREVDWAAGKYRGWSAKVAEGRLAKHNLETPGLDLVEHTQNGHIWLTPAGWAFVWATGLIKPNWKVPA